MSISKKMRIIFISIIILMISIGAYSYYQLSHVNQTYTNMVSSELNGVYETAALQNNISKLSVYVRQYALDDHESNLKLIQDGEETIDQQINTLVSIAKSSEIKEKVKELQTLQQNMIAITDETVTAVQAHDDEKVQTLLKGDFRNNNIQLGNVSGEILDIVKQRFHTATSETDDNVWSSLMTLCIMIVVSIFIIVIILRIIQRTVVSPLNRVTFAAQEIAGGNLTVKDITISTKDEVGQLSKSFNEMKQSLKQMITISHENTMDLSSIADQLNSSTNVVANSSNQVAIDVENMSVNTNHIARNAQENIVTMTQSSTGIHEIVDATRSIRDKANTTTTLALNGSEQLQLAQTQMRVIYDNAAQTASLVQHLSTQSKEIQDITQLITDITEQTNLLALNASIEAARAGEHGKGFAVVADEVKKLAEQSKQSVVKIDERIHAMLTEITNVEQAMQQGVSNVKEGSLTIDATNEMFANITAAFEDITSKLSSISVATEQISASTTQVHASTENVNERIEHLAHNSENITQQVEEQTATIQEINAVSENIAEKSQQLAAIISKFKLN